MALPFPINANQTDAKSPIDQQLMDAIRLNQEFLDSQLGGASAGGVLNFRVNGFLTKIKALLDQGRGKRLDGGLVSAAVTFTKASLYLEKSGTSGALEVDVFRHKELQHPITSIEALLSEAITGYGVLGSGLATQSVTRQTADVATQQVNRAKTTLDIESVQAFTSGSMLVTIEGAALLDEDYQIGKQVVISGANGANNGAWIIEGVNIDGLPSILISNPSAVNENASTGTLDLNLFEYVFNAAVDPAFVAGETAFFDNHDDGNNNGFKEIYKVNEGGNNILAYVTNGSTQASFNGLAQCLRLVYTFSAPVDTDAYVIGELADLSGHSSGNNNGFLKIVGVNEGGSNIVIINDSNGGDTQAGAGGTANSRRSTITFSLDPAGILEVSDKVIVSGRGNSDQNGTFEVKVLKKNGLNNIVIYLGALNNSTGAGGTITSEKKQVNFAEDFSASYIAGTSKAQLEGIGSNTNQIFEREVVEINRGGFTNYNIVILDLEDIAQVAAAGRVSREIRTIFDQRPRIDYAVNTPRNLQKDLNATFTAGGVEADTILTLEVLEVPEGLPSTMVLSLS